MLKFCPTCKTEKEFSEFSPCKKGKYKLFTYCKPCASKKTSDRYHKNIVASRERNRLRDQLNPEAAREKCRSFYREKKESDHAYLLWAAARNRAKKKGIEFSLDRADVVIPKICPVLGIELSKDTYRGFTDNSPSIDRIDSSKGYTKDNIIVISWRANSLKSNATLDELKKIYFFYKKLA